MVLAEGSAGEFVQAWVFQLELVIFLSPVFFSPSRIEVVLKGVPEPGFLYDRILDRR